MGLLDKIGVGKVLDRFKKSDDDDYDDYDEDEDFDPAEFEGDPDAGLGASGAGDDLDPDDLGDIDLDDIDLDGGPSVDTGMGTDAEAEAEGPAEEGASSGDGLPALPDEMDDASQGGEGSGDDIDDDIPDFDDGDFDEEDWEEEGEEAPGKLDPRQIGLIAAGVLILLGIFGGAGWWFLGGADDDASPGMPVAEAEDVPMAAALIPPKAGQSLNEIGSVGAANRASPVGAGGGAVNPDGTPMAQELTMDAPGNDGVSAQQAPDGGVTVPQVGVRTFARMPVVPLDKSLSVVPDLKLTEQTDQGLLPVVGVDGRKPWQVYAKPFTADEKARKVAIIVTGLGMSKAATEAAISRLPGAVTLAFSPYADGLEDWVVKARDAGHEVLLSLPLQPESFPFHDPGPYALMAYNSAEDTVSQLNYLLSRMVGYVGLLNTEGTKYVSRDDLMEPLLKQLNKRGLMYVDAATSRKSISREIASYVGIPRVFSQTRLDSKPSKHGVDDSLEALEMALQSQNTQVAVTRAYPIVLEQLAHWIKNLQQKNIILAPVSALADTSKVERIEEAEAPATPTVMPVAPGGAGGGDKEGGH